MDKNQMINQIKETLKSVMRFSNQEVELADEDVPTDLTVKLEDGTELIISGSELKVDADIKKTDGSALEDGEYTIEGGQVIVVAGGKISELKESTPEETPVEDAAVEMADEPKEETPSEEPKEDTGDLDKRVTDLEAQVEELLNMLKGMADNNVEMSEEFSSMKEKVEEFAKAPADESIKTNKKTNDTILTPREIRAERLKELAKSMK